MVDKDRVQIIRAEVSKIREVPQSLMKMKGRKREVVIARQLTCYFSKCYTKLTLDKIAEITEFPKYKHADVIYAIKTIRNLIDTDRIIRKCVVELEQILDEKLKPLPPYARNWNKVYDFKFKID